MAKKFEKSGDGEAKAIPSAEDLVASSSHPEGPPRSMEEAAMSQKMVQVQSDYKAKNRAQYLQSMDVVGRHSPSKRLKIKASPADPFAYRWCHEERRRKVGMKGWEALDGSSEKDWKLAQSMVDSAHLKKGEDGKIMSGDVFLCRKPKEDHESLVALYYQRSQRNMEAAVQGSAPSLNRSGGQATAATDASTFDDLRRRTTTADDPAGGIRMTGKLHTSGGEE